MRNIKLTIEYDGTQFNGWQIQNNKERTVQGELEKALKKIFRKSLRVHGSGRTDAGVHAEGQVAHFTTNAKLPVEQILKALNAHLPDDIAIRKAERTGAGFHAQYSAKSKLYRYTILNRPAPSALARHFALHFPYRLNIPAMRRAAKELVGRKDFRSFAAVDPARKSLSTVRTIKRIDIKKSGDFIYIFIEADGFLYKMVRNIVGTLLEIGQGRLPKNSIKRILSQKDRKAAPKTAKAHGLCLMSVKY